ncbi:hypothetical protein L2E82_35467 [Cichorium intybus]|uniref:Uncharacterized protein n=1 Tax=Cichorium intybus TaxID=13427 RepID=A0ACB9BNX2_CICIN|nr:hypothetical protein L2E82_35467 [Cichorium intybus]
MFLSLNTTHMHTHNSRAYTLHHFWKIIFGSEDENTKLYTGDATATTVFDFFIANPDLVPLPIHRLHRLTLFRSVGCRRGTSLVDIKPTAGGGICWLATLINVLGKDE